MNISKNISLLLCLVFAFSCKNETKVSDANPIQESENISTAFKGTGAQDISATASLDRNQFIPDESCAFNFKNQNVFRMYITSTNEHKPIIFNDNEVFAIFADTTSFKTDFKVDGYDTKGENTIVSVSTMQTSHEMNPHTPSFVMTIPKKDVKGFPIIKLNGVQVPLTTME